MKIYLFCYKSSEYDDVEKNAFIVGELMYGLGVNNRFLWYDRGILHFTSYQPENDILLKICRL